MGGWRGGALPFSVRGPHSWRTRATRARRRHRLAAHTVVDRRRRYAAVGGPLARPGAEQSVEPLDVQIGIHCGSAIAGVIGHRGVQYDLVGDAVNTAARMCSYSAPGRVHVSAEAYTHLSAHFAATPRGEIEVKGKGKMATYFLDGRRVSATKPPSPC